MKILAIETSAKAASVCLCEDEFLIAQSYQNSGLTHSQTILPMCTALLDGCGVKMSDVDLIACAAGPGSFTGLRIGLSTAKGLAWSLEKPCCGVSTLEAMAWQAAHIPGPIICAMDARRNQVYNACFSSDGESLTRLTEDRAIALSDLFEEITEKKGHIVVGDGAELCYNYGRKLGAELKLAPPHFRFQSAWGVARAALVQAKTGAITDAEGLNANYIRLSQAERERMERIHKMKGE
ncbi:MAG: tRNA (adenosine(37)-N6)-threonylcarbamoyltransferase complex dimerization subunit type 1 TsaB [Oscillospiraceae bacterium]|nr:tRNA (adenosine(37)-N6)-threonylcarbamoyltransferase complex dimerization subunit type 1 TsaB [Oscillospiraceae bacterium]